MVLLGTVLRAVPILVNTIRFGAANKLNFFSLVFLRLFSQLLANDISPNNCSIKKLINFAEGIIFNPLMSAKPFVFFHLLQEAFFRSTTKFSLPISKSFHKNIQENSVNGDSAFWQDYIGSFIWTVQLLETSFKLEKILSYSRFVPMLFS